MSLPIFVIVAAPATPTVVTFLSLRFLLYEAWSEGKRMGAKPENSVAPRLPDQGLLLLIQDVQLVAQPDHHYENVSVKEQVLTGRKAQRRRRPASTTSVAVDTSNEITYFTGG
jgi:hypothetical protein